MRQCPSCEKVADSLYRKDYISEEEKEIYSYGYEISLIMWKNFSVTMVGAIIHQLVATLVFVVVLYFIAQLLWRLSCIKDVAV